MYTINLSFDKTIKAYSRESKLYKYSKKEIKNITVGDMITKSLNSSFKIINHSLCNDSKKQLDYLVNLINNQELQFNMLLLDLRGLWLTFDKAFQKDNAEKSKVHIDNIEQYINACKNNDLYSWKKENLDLNLVNICLLFKLSQPIHKDLNGLNTIAIFCDLNIQKNVNQNDIVSNLIIKRIELLELNNEISNNRRINIVIDNNNPNFDYEPSFYADLCNLSPIISFDKKSSDLRKYLRYDDWINFIFAIRDYYKAKKEEISENNQILYFLGEDTTYNSNDDVECYLLQKKGSSASINKSEKSKYFLINRDDEADKYKISLNDLEFDASNTLIKKLEDEIKLLIQNISKFKKDNVTLEETINNLELEKQNLQEDLEIKSSKLDEINDNLNKNNQDLNNLSSSLKKLNEKLQVLNQELREVAKDKVLKDDERTNKNETLLNQIKKTKLEIDKLNADINNSDNSIKELEKQESIQKEEIKNVEKDLKSSENSIKKNKQKVSSNDQEISNNNSKLEKYNNQIEILKQGEYNVSKISFAFSDEDNFNPLTLKDSALSDNFKSANNFYINQEDTGTLAILNRYADGLEQIKSGYYKNPYLFANLIQPDSLRVKITKEIDKTILNNYQLNQNQENAVRKAINIDNFFYLQGPPGTGKTQTICAIANQYAIENKTILMTSQSHEAINNFFDRLDELNRNNPLLIMIKYIANEEMNESNKYNIDYAWKCFLIKCINACNPLDSEKEKYLQVIHELETNNFKIPAFMTSSEEEIVINDRSLLNNLTSMNRFDDDSKIQEIIKYSTEYESNPDFKKLIEAFSTRAKNKDTNNKDFLDKYDNLINELNKQARLTKLFDNLQEIKDYLNKNNNNNKYVLLFKKCYLNNDKDLKNSSKFKDYIVKNHLINIFGITTTSKITLSLLKNNDTDLFYDWPIDIVIIDEISKSTTPEILSRIVLAKKVIFAGDYKQLPPKSDFNEDEC
ncbi:MAG: AAA family ATPase, partial [Mycoplasmataceae bacterium]|nr:AAA family ATPase [Mycoplasmataceae bacterium]